MFLGCFTRGTRERAIFNAGEILKNIFPFLVVVSWAAAEGRGQKGCHSLSHMIAHSIEDELRAVAKLVTSGAKGSSLQLKLPWIRKSVPL